MKYLTGFFFLLLAILVSGFVVILSFLNLLPGLSEGFNANKVVDLGIAYDPLDLALGLRKTGVEIGELPAEDFLLTTIQYSGLHSVNETFTDRELTALANQSSWKNYPLESVQIRIKSDNSVEVSGLLKSEKLVDYLEATGNSQGMVARVLALFNLSQRKVPFYFQGVVSVQDEEVSLDLKKVVLGRLSLPKSTLLENKVNLESFIKERMAFVKGLSIQSLSFENEEMKFAGFLPDRELIRSEQPE